jgi:hypothetical protein
MVESQPSKLLVASSILVSRSKSSTTCQLRGAGEPGPGAFYRISFPDQVSGGLTG